MGMRVVLRHLLMVGAVVVWASGVSRAVSPADLPPALRALPMQDLIGLFSVPYEAPSLAAEIARHEAWVPPTSNDESVCPALVKVIQEYPRTADARRSLLDVAGIYARKGDWKSAQAPFLYVMEAQKGRPEARIAHLRLVEMYRYAGTPEGVNTIEECRKAVAAYAGTPEEGLGRMLLADLLAADDPASAQAYAEFQRVLDGFPGQSYTNYTRVRYALAMESAGQYDRVAAVLDPAVGDPSWGGRAKWVRGKAYLTQKRYEEAIADLTAAAQTADSVWVRGEAYAELGRAYQATERPGLAADAYQAALSIAPFRGGRVDTYLDLIRCRIAAGQYSEASSAAIEIEMDVLNNTTRYTEGERRAGIRELPALLAACRKALSSQPVGPS
jgi:tetratricopeptide (TPR) repeat protein